MVCVLHGRKLQTALCEKLFNSVSSGIWVDPTFSVPIYIFVCAEEIINDSLINFPFVFCI